MITPEGGAVPAHYGFGIGIEQLRGQTLQQQGGGINGFATPLVYPPAKQLSVALLSDSDGAAGLNLDLIARKLAAKAQIGRRGDTATQAFQSAVGNCWDGR